MQGNAMKDRIIAILILTVIITTSIFYYFIAVLIWLLTRPFDRRLRLLHLYTCYWGAFYTYIVPAWKISIEGREKIRRDATYVIVSNHQSQLDILVLFRLYVHFKWVSKSEIFKIPLIGWNMVMNRYIKLRRGDKESIAQMMADSEERLSEGSSIFIFPEGSRSYVDPDGAVVMKYINPRYFEAYMRPGDYIAPVNLVGGSDLTRGWRLRRARLGISMDDPFEVTARMLKNFEKAGLAVMQKIAALPNIKIVRFKEEIQNRA